MMESIVEGIMARVTSAGGIFSMEAEEVTLSAATFFCHGPRKRATQLGVTGRPNRLNRPRAIVMRISVFTWVARLRGP
jgi:hypothetical protein